MSTGRLAEIQAAHPVCKHLDGKQCCNECWLVARVTGLEQQVAKAWRDGEADGINAALDRAADLVKQMEPAHVAIAAAIRNLKEQP